MSRTDAHSRRTGGLDPVLPPPARTLIELVRESYGTHLRIRNFLEDYHRTGRKEAARAEDWRRISLEDFHVFDAHPRGREAHEIVVDLFFEMIEPSQEEDVREKSLAGLFEYLRKIMNDSGPNLDRNLPLVDRAFNRVLSAVPDGDSLLKKSARDMKLILGTCLERNLPLSRGAYQSLAGRAFRSSFDYWLAQPDPEEGFIPFKAEDGDGADRDLYLSLVEPLSRKRLREWKSLVDACDGGSEPGDWAGFSGLLEWPDYYQIAKGYLKIADEIEKASFSDGRRHEIRLLYLFRIISVPGFRDIHREALIEINRSLGRVFAGLPPDKREPMISLLFQTFRESAARAAYPDTMMSCLSTAAREVFKLDRHPEVKVLLDEIIRFGFVGPGIRGATTDWEVKFNPLHVKNIRAWIEIIALKPRWTKPLLSALIAHLKIGGVFVRDADLLQKDISALLNADITPAHNLVLQLARLFPVYFNDINAGGELRDNTTRLDALCFREDPLIHFIRKQTHVECNSTLVPFCEAVLEYWAAGRKEGMKPFLPAEIYDALQPSGPFYDGLHRVMAGVSREAGGDLRETLAWDQMKILKTVREIPDVPEPDREKAALFLRLYQLLHRKYFVQHQDVLKDLDASFLFDRRKIDILKRALARQTPGPALTALLEFLEILKDRFLSPKKTEAMEDLYEKRHIAVGIPSVYGTYREEKFDALRLYLKLQSLADVQLERALAPVNLRFITRSTLVEIHRFLVIFLKVLALEGIATEGLTSKVRLLEGALKAPRFSMAQYTDIFQFISKGVQDVIHVYFIDAHRARLPLVIRQVLAALPQEERPGPDKEEEEIYIRTENFIRSLIASSFGLQTIDHFVSTILRTLCAEEEKFKDQAHLRNVLMSYDPGAAVVPIGEKMGLRDDQILLGNKGYFLKKLHSFGFPVPPGFILTTEVFRCKEAIRSDRNIGRDLDQRIDRQLRILEQTARKKLGDPHNPLLLSVRSGSAISAPGMMTSFLNVGLNDQIAAALAARPRYAWAAWDCYRRFLQFWGMSEGMDRDFFDDTIDQFKADLGIVKKFDFTPEQMRDIAFAYRKGLVQSGITLPDNPREQLDKAFFKVIESWDSPRAEIYRAEMNISSDWGTAVIVQAMVYGNLNSDSGTGVIFTREPKGLTSSVSLFGDFTHGAQGDDIVTGLVETYPISETQRISEGRDEPMSLESQFPAIYGELKRLAETLVYEKGFEHQEIEFTFESATKEGLYILQTRDLPPPEPARVKVFTRTEKLEKSRLGNGIGISGGALCGRAVFSEADIEEFSRQDPNVPLILIRPDTVPDDIGLLRGVEGLLTAKGGSTSHAAVIIPQLKKVGVVGLRSLKVDEKSGTGTIHGAVIRRGDFFSLDGWSGAVYRGRHRIEPEPAVPAKV